MAIGEINCRNVRPIRIYGEEQRSDLRPPCIRIEQ